MPCVSLQRKRDYAAHLSRWISTDLAGLVDGVNLYGYVNGNPVRLVDPSGNASDSSMVLANVDVKALPETPTLGGMRGNASGSFDTSSSSASSATNPASSPTAPLKVDISSLHREIQGESAKFSGSGMTFGFVDVAKWKTDSEYLMKFKPMFVYKNRELIKAASARFDIPPELLAGVMFNEIGGKDPIKPYVYSIRSWVPFTSDRDKTSLGQQAMQVRRAAESLGYNPTTLSDNQRQQVLATLSDPVQSIFLAAKHISDLRDVDSKGKNASELTTSDVQIIGARYNQGPQVPLDRLKKDLSYGELITVRWTLLGSLLSKMPPQVEYSPIQNNLVSPINQSINNWLYQTERSIYQLYGVPR